MERVDDETVGFEFAMEPFDGGAVGSHADLTKDMLAGSGEVGGIEDDLVVLEAELEGVALTLTLFFGEVVPFKVVHAIVHAVLRCTLPQRVHILSPELARQRLISLVFKESVSSADRGLNHDVSDGDHNITGAHGAVLVGDAPLGHVDGLGPVDGVGTVGLDALALEQTRQILELLVGTVDGGLELGTCGPGDEASHVRVTVNGGRGGGLLRLESGKVSIADNTSLQLSPLSISVYLSEH